MAFFSNLNDLAKNIGDKTKDAIEIGKLTTKISSEKSAITELQKKLGEYYYNKYAAGVETDNEALELCTDIDEHKKAISEAQAEIERIKAVSEAANKATAGTSHDASGVIICSSCGTSNPKDTKFCKDCGSKLVSPLAAEGLICAACGASNPKDTKFCKDCGSKLAAPAPSGVSCSSCGALNPSGTKFCSECGKKFD